MFEDRAAEKGEILERRRRPSELVRHSQSGDAVAHGPRQLRELDRIARHNAPMSLFIADRLEQHVERRLGVLDELRIAAPILQESRRTSSGNATGSRGRS